MNIDKTSYRLAESQYYPDRQVKDLIVLHFTAGQSCESAFRTWAGDAQHIATAYGVDPDGTVREFFPPECWAYHLGVAGTRRHDKRSIGIEIANVGPLRVSPQDPQQLNWWPKDWGTRFCGVDETAKYVKHSYRGIEYWAVMPEAQQIAVGELVRSLCERFHIDLAWNSVVERGEYALGAMGNYAGIATHTNFRLDKWDVGPAFDWKHLGTPHRETYTPHASGA